MVRRFAVAVPSLLLVGLLAGCNGVISETATETAQTFTNSDASALTEENDAGLADRALLDTVIPDAAPDARVTPPDSAPAGPRITTGDALFDRYDQVILQATAKYRFSDPMIVKSMMRHESNFEWTVISGDAPCGIPEGWTDLQSRSFGLLQITPACVRWFAKLPSGLPNVTKDSTSPNWSTSAYNPTYNVDSAVRALGEFILPELRQKYPGCTQAQYMMMTIGAYNSGNNSVTGCGTWNERANRYVTFIRMHYQVLADLADIPFPY